jgi:imidazolonepropionase
VSDLLVRRIGRLTTWEQPVLSDAALLIRDGVVAWYGADSEIPADVGDIHELDAGGAAVLPGFVDAHTHLVWAGSRRDDFIGRIEGGNYSPQGIAATVAATRAASYDDLRALTQRRIDRAVASGTTTIEVKSGYGLTPVDEHRILDVARSLTTARVHATYLGAHVVPDGRDRSVYVDEVVHAIADINADSVDVFCDAGAFTVDESRRILQAAKQRRLQTRIHAEQLTHTGAARLAAELQCASADHLDHVTAEDATALAAANVVAVVVPVCSLYTRSQRWEHARILLDAGCTLAIATDCNPGTAWNESMPYAMQLAALAMGLTVQQTLRAATLGGAAALQRRDIGWLGVGARGDLVVLGEEHEADVLAHLGRTDMIRTVVGGSPTG